MNKSGKKCHYFNNFKTCPYESIGCKFIHEASEKCFFLSKCENKLCQFQHDANKKVEETKNKENHKGFTIVRKKQVIYKCAICEYRANDVEVVRKHTTEMHRGNNGDKEKVNVSDSDNNGETIDHEENIDNGNRENDEDFHDSVTTYLKEYRKKKKESEQVSKSGGPGAQSPGFHKL